MEIHRAKNFIGVFDKEDRAKRASISQMIRKMAGIFGVDENLVEPVQKGFFNQLVKRPWDTSFRTVKMRDVLGIEPLSFYEGFMAMKDCRK